MLHALRTKAPARAIFLTFTAAWVGVALLMPPITKRAPGTTTFIEAFSTATSAIRVTGRNTVVTFRYCGQVAIAVLIQVGGFGVMRLATLVGLTMLRRRLLAPGCLAPPRLTPRVSATY